MTIGILMAPADDMRDYRSMKHVVAIILLCLPAQLSAGDRCRFAQADRAEIAKVWNAKAQRADVARAHKIRALIAWRAVLYEQQIL